MILKLTVISQLFRTKVSANILDQIAQGNFREDFRLDFYIGFNLVRALDTLKDKTPVRQDECNKFKQLYNSKE